MNTHIYWPIWIAAFAFLLLLAGVEKADSKTATVCSGNVCATITLPKKGKCIWRTIRKYKVRICR